jgi:hypothetical protein
MSRRVEIPAGTRFGKLVVVREVEGKRTDSRTIRRQFLCHCDCDTAKPVYLTIMSLLYRGTQSCGCLMRETNSRRGMAGGMYGHELRKIWAGIVARCSNPNATGYENYGGRGIKLHGPWYYLPAFIADVEAEIGPRPSLDMTIDRENPEWNYEPGRIRWLPRKDQPKSRRPVYNSTEVAELLAQHHCPGCQCSR